MTDADRHHYHGKLQPMAPDPWHDRKRHSATRLWVGALGLVLVGLVVLL